MKHAIANPVRKTITKKEIYLMLRKENKHQITMQEWWDFIAQLADDEKEVLKEVVKQNVDAHHRLQDYHNSYRVRMKIRKYCNQCFPNDAYPYEVVKVVSPTCVVIREMDVKQTVFPKVFVPGGFVGHTVDNHNQDYEYISNPNNPTKRIHLSKKGWGKGYHRMSNEPYKFYDYNL